MSTARVIYHYEDEAWWAESPEVPRWSAAGATFAEVRRLAEEGIPSLTHGSGWEFRHVIPSDLVPFFTQRTAGVAARVVRVVTAGPISLDLAGPPAGIARELSAA